MRRVSSLMEGYFRKKVLTEDIRVDVTKLPVKKNAGSVGWERKQDPPRFYRKFKFRNHEDFLNFLNAVLQYENEVKHNAKIVIGYPEVVIQIWTHGLEDITDLDIKYIQEVNYILNEMS